MPNSFVFTAVNEKVGSLLWATKDLLLYCFNTLTDINETEKLFYSTWAATDTV